MHAHVSTLERPAGLPQYMYIHVAIDGHVYTKGACIIHIIIWGCFHSSLFFMIVTWDCNLLLVAADVSVASDVNISNILVVEPANRLIIQVPHYSDAQSSNRTAVMQLVTPSLSQGKFLHPDVMTLHVISECVCVCACVRVCVCACLHACVRACVCVCSMCV